MHTSNIIMTLNVCLASMCTLKHCEEGIINLQLHQILFYGPYTVTISRRLKPILFIIQAERSLPIGYHAPMNMFLGNIGLQRYINWPQLGLTLKLTNYHNNVNYSNPY